MSNGDWSYRDYKTGDTSQTQYAVLGMWMASKRHIDVPRNSTERVDSWLMRVQAPNGSWGYQGKDPGSYEQVTQDTESHSLAAAGLGSSYACAELLGIISSPDENQHSRDIPPAVREVAEERKTTTDRDTTTIPAAVLRNSLASGDDWFKSLRTLQAREYQHYFLYAMERYMSFRAAVKGLKENEPAWYDWGVDHLSKTQAVDGSWKSCEAGPVIDTSFAVLFLLRGAACRKGGDRQGRERPFAPDEAHDEDGFGGARKGGEN